jgi:DNA-binding transcriptional MerR regulator
MFGLEEKDKKTDMDQQLKKLEIEIEAMQKESQEHLEEVGLSIEEIGEYIENPNNFSKKTWETLQFHLRRLDEKLETDLQQIANPKKIAEAYKEQRDNAVHWVPVR